MPYSPSTPSKLRLPEISPLSPSSSVKRISAGISFGGELSATAFVMTVRRLVGLEHDTAIPIIRTAGIIKSVSYTHLTLPTN